MRVYPVSVLTILLCSGLAAHAQQVGNYEGSTADGSAVLITVAQDPSNSNLEVTVLSFDLSMRCTKSGETLKHIGIGLGNGEDIVGGKFSYASSDFYSIDLVTSMTFHGLDNVKGTVGGDLAAFNPAFGHNTLTKSVQPCVSPKQSFTATFTGAPKYFIAPGTVEIHDQPLIKR